MSDLVVYTYETEAKALEVLNHVAAQKQENVQKPLIGIEDAAVVTKSADGRVKVRQTLESVAKTSNIISGGFWGLLIGFLFGGPIFGALLGFGFSALFGRKIDLGIDNAFIKKVGDDLQPGNSALFMLINNTPVDTISGALNEFGGTLYHTSLPEEAMEAMNKAMENEDIKSAVEEHNTEEDNK